MKIPQFDLTRQYEQIEPEIQSAIRHVLRGGQFILGAEGEAFEAECAAYLGVKHAIGLGSGSDAIRLVLHALGVGPDTEVVTPAFSFVASATAALQLGARPVFVDIDPATFGLDPDRVSAAITPRTRVILAVHLYGLAMDAYAEDEADLAAALDDMDDRLDQLHKDYIQAILELHADARDVQAAVQLALVGRYYERIGDHAVDIGERVQYMVTGWLPEHAGAARLAARATALGVDPG